MNLVIVTDNQTATLSTMKAFSPTPVDVYTTSNNYIVWVWESANASDVNTVQNADYSYASTMLP